MIMGYQDESRLFVIIRDQVWLVACVSLECAGFRECFVVVSLTERYIPWLVRS